MSPSRAVLWSTGWCLVVALAAPAAAQSGPADMFPAPPVVPAPAGDGSASSTTQPVPALPADPTASPAVVEDGGSGFPWGAAIGGGAACTACTLVSGSISGLGIYFLIESLNQASQARDPFGACCISVIGIAGALVTNAVAVVLGGGLGPFSVAVGAIIGALVDGRPPWWGVLGSVPGAIVGLSGLGLAVASLTILDDRLSSLRSAPGEVEPKFLVLGTGVALSLLAPAITLVGAVGATWLWGGVDEPAVTSSAPAAGSTMRAPAGEGAVPPPLVEKDPAGISPEETAPPAPQDQDVVDY